MRNLLDPRWILLITVAPAIVLAVILFNSFQRVESMLDPENIEQWINYAFVFCMLLIVHLSYAVERIVNRKQIKIWYPVFSFFTTVPFGYLLIRNSNELIPWTIPSWLNTENITAHPLVFLFPTVIYAILLVALLAPQRDKRPLAALAGVIFVPIGWILLWLLVTPIFLGNLESHYEEFASVSFVVMAVASTLAMLFYFVRAAHARLQHKSRSWSIFLKLPVALILPIIGLSINNIEHDFVFGDFSHWAFYVVTVLNFAVLCMPDRESQFYRWLRFFLCSVTFSYTLYFFIVFLPLLPLSVFMILAVGLGFLMLAPLALFPIHINELMKSAAAVQLNRHVSTWTLVAVFMLGFGILPFCVHVNFLSQRNALFQALEYVYAPDYDKDYTINSRLLGRSLDAVEQNQNRGISFLGTTTGTPIFSAYYNALVLNNLTLSDKKIENFRQIFDLQANANNSFWGEMGGTRTGSFQQEIELTSLLTNTRYDEERDVYFSWVDLELLNKLNEMGEFETAFELPEGCWISDYYLYVGDEKKHGILTDKRAAQWIFREVKQVRKDPGLLNYEGGRRIEFRIFPFLSNELRKTGIEFMHAEPLTLSFMGQELDLSDGVERVITAPQNLEGIKYISRAAKSKLPVQTRKPYCHFIVDAAASGKISASEIQAQMKAASSILEVDEAKARVSFVGAYHKTFEVGSGSSQDWASWLRESQNSGGFYLGGALKRILIDHYNNGPFDSYPVFVWLDLPKVEADISTVNSSAAFVSNRPPLMDGGLDDLKFAFPESPYLFQWKNGGINAFDLTTDMKSPVIQNITAIPRPDVKCLEIGDQKYFFKNDDSPELAIGQEHLNLQANAAQSTGSFESALITEALWREQVIHPERRDAKWHKLVMASFSSRIMSPLTAYIVLETQAQEEAMLRKQAQLLAGDHKLDAGNALEEMSEPPFWLLLILGGFVLLVLHRRRLAQAA